MAWVGAEYSKTKITSNKNGAAQTDFMSRKNGPCK